jgi:hypothetical protein
MPSHSLDPDTLLCVELSGIMSRDRYTRDPGPVIARLREVAGDRVDLLAVEVGGWIGFYDNTHTHTLTEALQTSFVDLDLQPHIAAGRARRYTPTHRTP